MKIRQNFVILILLLLSQMDAQIDNASFLFTERFTFEDSRGNHDTVYLSGSHLANGDYNPELGQVNITNIPFDSVFEVRMVRTRDVFSFNTGMPFMFKHAIGHLSGPTTANFCSDGVTWYSFAVWAKYPPVTFRWDTTGYQAGGALECYPNSYINNTLLEATWVRWWEAAAVGSVDYACLGKIGEHTFIPFAPPVYHDPKKSYIISSIYSGDSLVQDTIDCYPWNIGGPGWQPCAPIPNSVSDLTTVPVKLYPNPTTDLIRIKLPENSVVAKTTIFAVSGQLIGEREDEEASWNTSQLSPGLYYLKINFRDGRTALEQFVKQ